MGKTGIVLTVAAALAVIALIVGAPRDDRSPIPPAPTTRPAAAIAPTEAAPRSDEAGCADSTREGFSELPLFPDVAACAGAWRGWIDEGSPQSLCAPGWHVCRGTDKAIGRVTVAQATAFAGCFAFDAAHDCNACYPTCRGALGQCKACCVPNVPSDPDMGGVGSGCLQHSPGAGSCLADGRLDATQNSTGCQWSERITGVVCCRDGAR